MYNKKNVRHFNRTNDRWSLRSMFCYPRKYKRSRGIRKIRGMDDVKFLLGTTKKYGNN